MGNPKKAKGNRFENVIAKMLSDWSGKEFRRVPASGAIRWNGTFWTFGDLTPPEDFTFVVECKDHADVGFVNLLSPEYPDESDHPANFANWWYRQAVADAERASSLLCRPFGALLFWKQTRTASKVCIDSELYNRLPNESRANLPSFWVYIPNKRPFMVCETRAFLNNVSYGTLVNLPLAQGYLGS